MVNWEQHELNEYDGRKILWNAADYLFRNQLGQHSRVQAMDLLDDIRRDIANWRDLSGFYGVQHRDYVVFRSR